jgi:hypothetical protein
MEFFQGSCTLSKLAEGKVCHTRAVTVATNVAIQEGDRVVFCIPLGFGEKVIHSKCSHTTTSQVDGLELLEVQSHQDVAEGMTRIFSTSTLEFLSKKVLDARWKRSGNMATVCLAETAE